jgi:hypothetical protein
LDNFNLEVLKSFLYFSIHSNITPRLQRTTQQTKLNWTDQNEWENFILLFYFAQTNTFQMLRIKYVILCSYFRLNSRRARADNTTTPNTKKYFNFAVFHIYFCDQVWIIFLCLFPSIQFIFYWRRNKFVHKLLLFEWENPVMFFRWMESWLSYFDSFMLRVILSLIFGFKSSLDFQMVKSTIPYNQNSDLLKIKFIWKIVRKKLHIKKGRKWWM